MRKDLKAYFEAITHTAGDPLTIRPILGRYRPPVIFTPHFDSLNQPSNCSTGSGLLMK